MTKKDFQNQIGQLILMGIAQPSLLPEERKAIASMQPSGVIYFRRNVASAEQLSELSHSIYEICNELPMIGIDQEGGRVARLGAPFTVFPGNDYLGRAFVSTKKDTLADQQATAMARELKSIGVNLNFTPVADIDSNPNNPIIGPRAFSSDPKLVAKLVAKTVHAYRKQNVISCAKHFPGHGDSTLDSHLALPYIDITKKTLTTRELIPFQAAIRAKVPTIMTAHVVYPQLDSLPATLSKKILEGILRKKMKFTGVLMSDDMEMSAIAGNMDIPQASVEAIKAGVDMLLVCKRLDLTLQVHEAIVKAVESKKLSKPRVMQALRRVELMKKKYVTQKSFTALRKKKTFGWMGHQKLAEKIKKF
jgi:beta-N-acetylhexosaminidase